MIESIYKMNMSVTSWLTSDKGVTALVLAGCVFSCFFYYNLQEKHPFWKKNLLSFLKGFAASAGVLVASMMVINFVYFFHQLGFYYNSQLYTWSNLPIILVVVAMLINYAFYSEGKKSTPLSTRSKWLAMGIPCVIFVSTTIGYMNADELVKEIILRSSVLFFIPFLYSNHPSSEQLEKNSNK